MKLIVGLGNPGKLYENTRHNIGFMCIDYFCNKNNIEMKKEKFGGIYTKTNINGEDLLLLKPQTFINLSGEVIRKFIDYFNINIEDILIVNDDLDLEVGVYKLKQKGSSGGHNGLKNIELNLNTNTYKRLKIGISNNKQIDSKEYVLGKIPKGDLEKFYSLFKITNKIISDYMVMDFNSLMNKYNRK